MNRDTTYILWVTHKLPKQSFTFSPSFKIIGTQVLQDCSPFILNKLFYLFDFRMNDWRRNCVWCYMSVYLFINTNQTHIVCEIFWHPWIAIWKRNQTMWATQSRTHTHTHKFSFFFWRNHEKKSHDNNLQKIAAREESNKKKKKKEKKEVEDGRHRSDEES